MSFFSPFPARAITLTDAVNEAMHSNPKVRAAAQELEETRQRIRQAYAGFLPTIDITTGKGREWINSPYTRSSPEGGALVMTRGEAGMSINQPIFDGFNTLNKLSQTQAQVQSSEHSHREEIENVTLAVAEAFIDTQKQRSLLALAREALNIHSDLLIKTRQTAQLGINAEMDVRQAESRLSLIASELATTEGALRAAESRFSTLVGFPPGALAQATVPKHRLPTSRAEAMEVAMRLNPMLLSANSDLDATRAEGKVNAASLWPKISLDMSVSESNNAGGTRSYTQDATAMVNLRYNFFRGGADLAKFQETSHKSLRFREKLEQARRTVEEKVNGAWNALLASRARMQSLERHVDTTHAVNRDHKEKFRLGLQTMLDLLNSENELQASKRLLVQEQFQFMTESYRLLAAMGQLTEVLTKPESPAPMPHEDLPPVAEAQPPSPAPESAPPAPEARDAHISEVQEETMNLLAESLLNTPVPRPQPAVAAPEPPPAALPAPLPQPRSRPVRTEEVTDLEQISLLDFVHLMSDDESTPEAKRPPADLRQFAIQIGSFQEETAALELISQLQDKDYDLTLAESSEGALTWHQVRIGRFDTESAARAALQAFTEREGRPGYIIPLARQGFHSAASGQTSVQKAPRVPPAEGYAVQVAAFLAPEATEKMLAELAAKNNYHLYVCEKKDAKGRTWQLVWIGRFDNREEAQALAQDYFLHHKQPAVVIEVPSGTPNAPLRILSAGPLA
ncbi:MAG: TolC family outer membrane protein [Magnetococcales bacterium]|nr:TolC family outer membrane protein [Magnetococcales bacterium]